MTINRYCSSSLDSIRHAANAIKAGEGDTYIAAGVEWVSRYNERTEPAGERCPGRVQPFDQPAKPPDDIDLKFLNAGSFTAMFDFPTDLAPPDGEIEINRLDNQALVRYYETEWRRFE